MAVAFSGGADSTALLLDTFKKFPTQTVAFHIHHGLQPAAADFLVHCQKFCQHYKIPLFVRYVNVKKIAGQSPEDAARQARYQALIEMAHEHNVVISGGRILLAQHADDQIETLFLALSRGAGLPGLASMPRQFEREGVKFERPMLDHTALQIRTRLRDEKIAFIEDPTNSDKRFTRNKIRHDVLPAIRTTFPSYGSTFSRSIANIAEASELLNNLAEIDLVNVSIPPVITRLQQLTPQRQGNVIRFWLKQEYAISPSKAQLKELLRQIAACQTNSHRIHIKLALGVLTRQGDVLRYN